VPIAGVTASDPDASADVQRRELALVDRVPDRLLVELQDRGDVSTVMKSSCCCFATRFER
jgi:hypothetical protein